jgi:hypothetical protein
VLIDTLNAKNRLVDEYGVDECQAEGIVEIIASAEDKVATTSEMDSRLVAMEARLTRKMYGAAFLIITLLGALNFYTA